MVLSSFECTYDPLQRLVAANYCTGEFFRYTYDAVGNRLAQETLAGTNSYLYDSANRLIEVDGAPYTWDDNGNLLADGVRDYRFDHANRLTSVGVGDATHEFSYNGLGDRLNQTVNAAPIEYSLGLAAGLTQVLSDGDNAYLYGVTRIGEQQQEEWEYHLGDTLGSVRQLVAPSALVRLMRAYEPFGSGHAVAGSTTSPYGFAGVQQEPTGFLYLRARYMHPTVGRFITRDIWPVDAFNPGTLSRYAYAENQPIDLRDPSGSISEAEAQQADEIVARLRQQFGVQLQHDWGYVIAAHHSAGNFQLLGNGCEWREGSLRELSELHLIEDAVAIAAGRMGGSGRFRTAMQGVVRISRWNLPIRELRSFSPPLPFTFLGDIVLTDYAFNAASYRDEFVIHTVIHEVGHVWDWRTGRDLSIGMAKELETLQCQIHPFFGEVCEFDIAAGKEPPPGNRSSPYAGANALEDWADTFATYLYPDYYSALQYRLVESNSIRERFVENSIKSAP